METNTALVVIVTRNNPGLIKHATESYLRYDAGHPCQYIIVDNESDATCQSVISKCVRDLNAQIYRASNDRVECSFQRVWQMFRMSAHSLFFFVHDDCVPIQNGWLKAYVDRLNSGYCEPETPEQYKALPIGRVGTSHHFWRGYDAVKGFPVQCLFLENFLARCTQYPVPPMFKYADVDRVLVTRTCMKATDGLVTVRNVSSLASNRQELNKVLDTFLPYPDEGTYPSNEFPPGMRWNKKTLLSEFMNSVNPLLQGFRTVGVKGDGYLEQIHGHDVPWGHAPVAHYGAPNALSCLAKAFKTSSQQIKQQMNDPIFLLKSHRYFKENAT